MGELWRTFTIRRVGRQGSDSRYRFYVCGNEIRGGIFPPKGVNVLEESQHFRNHTLRVRRMRDLANGTHEICGKFYIITPRGEERAFGCDPRVAAMKRTPLNTLTQYLQKCGCTRHEVKRLLKFLKEDLTYLERKIHNQRGWFAKVVDPDHNISRKVIAVPYHEDDTEHVEACLSALEEDLGPEGAKWLVESMLWNEAQRPTQKFIQVALMIKALQTPKETKLLVPLGLKMGDREATRANVDRSERTLQRIHPDLGFTNRDCWARALYLEFRTHTSSGTLLLDGEMIQRKYQLRPLEDLCQDGHEGRLGSYPYSQVTMSGLSLVPAMYHLGDFNKVWALTEHLKQRLDVTDAQTTLQFLQMNPLVVLTGDPGTGKSTLIAQLVQSLMSKDVTIGLTSPTGKASSRQMALLRDRGIPFRRPSDMKNTPIVVGNIDKMLCTSGTERLDYLVVDETSMVSARKLLEALHQYHPDHLLLVGDPKQLPQIDRGQFFHQMLQFLELQRETDEDRDGHRYHRDLQGQLLPWVELTHIWRNEAQDIRQFHEDTSGLVHKIRTKIPHVYPCGMIEYIRVGVGDTASTLSQPLQDQIRTLIETHQLLHADMAIVTNSHMYSRQPAYQRGMHDRASVIEDLDRVVDDLRSPLRYRYFNGMKMYDGKPVMVTKNRHEHGVYNGQIGIVKNVNKNSVDVAFEDLPEGTGRRTFTRNIHEDDGLDLKLLTSGTVMTVHKSQGSEWDYVIVAVANDKFVHQQLLYTAVSRAKTKAFLVDVRYGQAWWAPPEIRHDPTTELLDM